MWSIPPENPEGRAFIAVLIVFLVIAYLACGLRVYSRRLGKSALDASDYMCFLAVVSTYNSATIFNITTDT